MMISHSQLNELWTLARVLTCRVSYLYDISFTFISRMFFYIKIFNCIILYKSIYRKLFKILTFLKAVKARDFLNPKTLSKLETHAIRLNPFLLCYAHTIPWTFQ